MDGTTMELVESPGENDKYRPLFEYLRDQAEAAVVECSFSLPDLEFRMGIRLPHSAYQWKATWWSNESSPVQAKTWLAAGWIAKVSPADRRVTFIRSNRQSQ